MGEPERATPSQLEAAAIGRVWDYFFELFPGKRRRPIDSTSRTLIKNALRLVEEGATKRALLGLSRSPFHNGANDQQKRYLELRYALKGKQRDGESDHDRIEKAISWAAVHAPGAQMEPEVVQRLLEDVRYTLSLPHRPMRERGLASYRRLEQAGFTITQLDKAPWARLER